MSHMFNLNIVIKHDIADSANIKRSTYTFYTHKKLLLRRYNYYYSLNQVSMSGLDSYLLAQKFSITVVRGGVRPYDTHALSVPSIGCNGVSRVLMPLCLEMPLCLAL